MNIKYNIQKRFFENKCFRSIFFRRRQKFINLRFFKKRDICLKKVMTDLPCTIRRWRY